MVTFEEEEEGSGEEQGTRETFRILVLCYFFFFTWAVVTWVCPPSLRHSFEISAIFCKYIILKLKW